jgi:hypothetical protein
MEEGDHSNCPVELQPCSEHHDSELKQESNMFACALQSVLDDAEVMDNGNCGTVPEVKE